MGIRWSCELFGYSCGKVALLAMGKCWLSSSLLDNVFVCRFLSHSYSSHANSPRYSSIFPHDIRYTNQFFVLQPVDALPTRAVSVHGYHVTSTPAEKSVLRIYCPSQIKYRENTRELAPQRHNRKLRTHNRKKNIVVENSSLCRCSSRHLATSVRPFHSRTDASTLHPRLLPSAY